MGCNALDGLFIIAQGIALGLAGSALYLALQGPVEPVCPVPTEVYASTHYDHAKEEWLLIKVEKLNVKIDK